MRSSLRYIVLLLMLATIAPTQMKAQVIIEKYKPVYGTATFNGQHYVCLREFLRNGTPQFLVVHPQTLETALIPQENVKFASANWNILLSRFSNTVYMKAINKAATTAWQEANAGITHGFPAEKGICLTIDLCPSHKSLDRNIFTSLISAMKSAQHPVPVGISITGRFMLKHRDDMRWLEALNKSGQIIIIWVNHTYTHHYDPHAPLDKNFLLAPGTDVSAEILKNEQLMLENDLLPSCFFRFPGLISDATVVKRVTSCGLIPIGSDAWLAKGQKTHNGSFVLIHGNGNEPLGVSDFIKLLQQKEKDVLNKEWLIYDLRQSIELEYR